MQSILSLLDVVHTAQVKELYAELEEKFGLRGVQAFAYPHVSYHILEGYSLATVETRLHDIAARFKPFQVNTAGLGIFLKPSPVLFVPVVRGTALERIHRLLWRAFPPLEGKGGFYSSDQWMPHITLARGDLSNAILPGVIELVSKHDFHWEITLDNLTFAGETDEGFVIQCTCRFEE
jgi:hypothetical protein